MKRRHALILAIAGVAALIVWLSPKPGRAIRRPPTIDRKAITLRARGIPEDWQVYINEEHGFQISHPPDWTITPPGPEIPGGRILSLPGLAPGPESEGRQIAFFVDIKIRLDAAVDNDDIESWFERNNPPEAEDKDTIARIFDIPSEEISIDVAPFETGAGRAVRKCFRIEAPGGPGTFALDKVEYLFLRGRDVLSITGFTPSGPKAAGAIESLDRAIATLSVTHK